MNHTHHNHANAVTGTQVPTLSMHSAHSTRTLPVHYTGTHHTILGTMNVHHTHGTQCICTCTSTTTQHQITSKAHHHSHELCKQSLNVHTAARTQSHFTRAMRAYRGNMARGKHCTALAHSHSTHHTQAHARETLPPHSSLSKLCVPCCPDQSNFILSIVC